MEIIITIKTLNVSKMGQTAEIQIWTFWKITLGFENCFLLASFQRKQEVLLKNLWMFLLHVFLLPYNKVLK